MNTPTVYTFINPYLGWIRQVTGIKAANPPSAPPPRPNPSPSPRPAARPSSSPGPSAPLDASWWRADILEMLHSPPSSPPAASPKNKCAEGGLNWIPNLKANGCQWCNAYASSMTKATCIDCCCSSGDSSKQFTYSGCPGLRFSQSPSAKMDWSGWEWNSGAADSSAPSGNRGSSSNTWGFSFMNRNNNNQPSYSSNYGR